MRGETRLARLRIGRRAKNRPAKYKLKIGNNTVMSYTLEEARELRRIIERGSIADGLSLANNPYRPSIRGIEKNMRAADVRLTGNHQRPRRTTASRP